MSRCIPRPILALAALLLVLSPSAAQDAASAKAVLSKVKEGAGFAKVKELLAASPAGARLRLDGFKPGGDGKSLAVSGVLLIPGANEEEQAAAAKQTQGSLIEAVRKVSGVDKFEDIAAGNLKEIRGERLPHLLLQKAANAAGAKTPAADELMLTNASFDAAGRLLLFGRRGAKPETLAWLKHAIAQTLAEHAAVIGPNGKLSDDNAQPWVRAEPIEAWTKTPAWPLTAAAIQQSLIHKNSPALARLRVDRFYLVSSPAKVDEANPAGVAWEYALSGIALGAEAPDARAIAKVCEEVFVAGQWEVMKSGNLEGLTGADCRVSDPGPKLQKAIAAIPMLDGVRIDGPTAFGADGKLLLNGLQPGLDEKGKQELTRTAVQVLKALARGSDGNPHYSQLSVNGISTDRMERIKIRELHVELKRWVAGRLEDVRLSRCFFNDDGILTLLCDSPPGDDARQAMAKVSAELKSRLSAYKFPAALRFLPATAEPPSPPEPIVKAGPSPFKESLTRRLQALVSDPKNSQWTDVLIERGCFNEANRYTVRGVVDSEAQKKRLARYIESLKDETEWAAYFQEPAAPPELDVIPMEELVERVQRVIPAYPLFDGLRITGAKYVFISKDASGFAGGLNLVFTGRVVGQPNLYECRVLLAKLIAEHPSYSRRLAKSSNDRFPRLRIEATPLELPQAGENLLSFANAFGASSLLRAQGLGFLERWSQLGKAKSWIDAGLSHYPDQSSLWFLDAYFNYTQGDLELARRDLYRAIAIENALPPNGGVQRQQRYEVARDFQGRERDELEKLWLTCWEEVKSGAKPMTMVPAR